MAACLESCESCCWLCLPAASTGGLRPAPPASCVPRDRRRRHAQRPHSSYRPAGRSYQTTSLLHRLVGPASAPAVPIMPPHGVPGHRPAQRSPGATAENDADMDAVRYRAHVTSSQQGPAYTPHGPPDTSSTSSTSSTSAQTPDGPAGSGAQKRKAPSSGTTKSSSSSSSRTADLANRAARMPYKRLRVTVSILDLRRPAAAGAPVPARYVHAQPAPPPPPPPPPRDGQALGRWDQPPPGVVGLPMLERRVRNPRTPSVPTRLNCTVFCHVRLWERSTLRMCAGAAASAAATAKRVGIMTTACAWQAQQLWCAASPALLKPPTEQTKLAFAELYAAGVTADPPPSPPCPLPSTTGHWK
eukprot:COSAG01_NODE_8724_length_2683_cov_3.317337_3_plen_358_part_00